jgi:hypothetical protein
LFCEELITTVHAPSTLNLSDTTSKLRTVAMFVCWLDTIFLNV